MAAAVGLALGAAIGLAIGGRFSNLGRLPLRYPYAIFALFLVQALSRARIVPSVHLSEAAVTAWGIASLALVFVASRSFRVVPGLSLLVVGWAMNLLVVLLNSGMPVLVSSLSPRPFYHAATKGDLLVFMADVIPAGSMLVSAGDLVAVVGIVTIIARGMCPTPDALLKSKVT